MRFRSCGLSAGSFPAGPSVAWRPTSRNPRWLRVQRALDGSSTSTSTSMSTTHPHFSVATNTGSAADQGRQRAPVLRRCRGTGIANLPICARGTGVGLKPSLEDKAFARFLIFPTLRRCDGMSAAWPPDRNGRRLDAEPLPGALPVPVMKVSVSGFRPSWSRPVDGVGDLFGSTKIRGVTRGRGTRPSG